MVHLPEAGRANRAVEHRRYLACALFLTLFALFAANFAYFFVDDEAIPFVYAQNLLDGHGLVYNPDDGPVEGYSDFLTVWIDTALLQAARLAGAGKLTALALAKLLSFVTACTLVALTCAMITSGRAVWSSPVVAGLSFISLAGPLALWAWSGLETTLFALLVALLVGTLLSAFRPGTNDRLMLAAIVLAVLCRIDGFVWVGALVTPFVVSATAARRRLLVRRVLVPALAAFALYHGWRLWYFGELLPMPVYAKVLYKLGARETLVTNAPPANYLIAFLNASSWLPVVILGLALAVLQRSSRDLSALAVGVVLLFGYLSLVGDWMFGSRFFVALLAPLAILTSALFDAISRRSSPLAAVAVLAWMAVVGRNAYAFERSYEWTQQRASWLAAPGLEPARFFAPYYQIYLRAREVIQPGETLAYNQAGFVPFMLGARNIDDLGICTKFYAQLPTTDIVFTEVGRYSPLTASRALRASDTYTAARAPRLLLEPGGNIRAANGGRTPADVLGGHYRLLFATETVAAYVPTGNAGPFDESQYLENLAHISHLRRVSLNSEVIDPSTYHERLPFLYERAGELRFSGRYAARFTFSEADEDVFGLSIGGVQSSGAISMDLRLLAADGHLTHRETLAVPSQTWRDFEIRFPEGRKAVALALVITPEDLGAREVAVLDVRVQGQTPELQRFLRESRLPGGQGP